MTQAELLDKGEFTAAKIKRFGKRVRLFSTEATIKKGQDWHDAITAVHRNVQACLDANKGAVLFTGIHNENDWSRTFYWLRGAHVCNRTGDYAVILVA
jgi:hypothetical protein